MSSNMAFLQITSLISIIAIVTKNINQKNNPAVQYKLCYSLFTDQHHYSQNPHMPDRHLPLRSDQEEFTRSDSQRQTGMVYLVIRAMCINTMAASSPPKQDKEACHPMLWRVYVCCFCTASKIDHQDTVSIHDHALVFAILEIDAPFLMELGMEISREGRRGILLLKRIRRNYITLGFLCFDETGSACGYSRLHGNRKDN